MNFGILENILSLLKGLGILLNVIPLCCDLSFTLVQKVNPSQLGFIVEEKLRVIGYMEGIVKVKKWHLWCLDKSYRILSVKVEISENTNPDNIKRMIEKKLLNKYCERVIVHII